MDEKGAELFITFEATLQGFDDAEDIKQQEKEKNLSILKHATSNKEVTQVKYKGKTIHKNSKCNTWYTRIRFNRKQYYISAKTQAECIQKLKETINNQQKLILNRPILMGNITFIEWYNFWLTKFKKDVKFETIRDYNKNLNKLNNIKNKDIKKISSLDINLLLDQEEKPRAKQKLYEFLKPIFTKAKDYKIIPEDIFDVIEKPKHSKSIGIALTKEQQVEFINLCDRHTYGNLFKFILFQGLRICEALGLSYNDIDFINKKIHICKQLTTQGIVNNTKNEQSTRIIPLFNKTVSLIKNLHTNERIFNISYQTANTKLNNIIKNSNLPKFTIHDLRHTFITNCQNNGIPEHVIQAIVGHEIGSKVTKQVYTHFNLEDNLFYINKLND